MSEIAELEIAEKKFEDGLAIVRRAKKAAIGNTRLTREDVAELTGYHMKSLYKFDIPFSPKGIIRYRILEKWIEKNKPSRLNRLRENIKALV